MREHLRPNNEGWRGEGLAGVGWGRWVMTHREIWAHPVGEPGLPSLPAVLLLVFWMPSTARAWVDKDAAAAAA